MPPPPAGPRVGRAAGVDAEPFGRLGSPRRFNVRLRTGLHLLDEHARCGPDALLLKPRSATSIFRRPRRHDSVKSLYSVTSAAQRVPEAISCPRLPPTTASVSGTSLFSQAPCAMTLPELCAVSLLLHRARGEDDDFAAITPPPRVELRDLELASRSRRLAFDDAMRASSAARRRRPCVLTTFCAPRDGVEFAEAPPEFRGSASRISPSTSATPGPPWRGCRRSSVSARD